MLQQTQVATVIPYYNRFLDAFSSVERLAEAHLEHVLELWSGLGYYRRARLLHLAARTIVSEFGGRLPDEYRALRSLPGIGDYTARAILSIAYNRPYTVIEGNVARVVARLAAIRGSIDQRAFRLAVEKELACLLSPRDPGTFNQALMELGQTVCLPALPRCSACPLRRWCRAYRLGAVEAYPLARTRRATESRYLAAALISRGAIPSPPSPVRLRAGERSGNSGRQEGMSRETLLAESGGRHHVAMVRGLDEGLLADLWNFPSAFGSSRLEAFTQLQQKLTSLLGHPLQWQGHEAHSKRGRETSLLIPASLSRTRHSITHRRIRIDVYAARAGPGALPASIRWMSFNQVSSAAVSELARKVAASAVKAVQQCIEKNI